MWHNAKLCMQIVQLGIHFNLIVTYYRTSTIYEPLDLWLSLGCAIKDKLWRFNLVFYTLKQDKDTMRKIPSI